MVQNDRGLTLVELLAAMALTGVLLTVAIMLYQSLFHVSETGMQRYADQTEIRHALNLLERELSDATDVRWTGGQLRYDNGLRARALVYDQNEDKLIVYDLNENGDLASAALNEASAAEIAGNVVAFTADVNSDARTVDLSITFEVSKVNVSGIRQPAAETRELSFKWMSVPE